MKTATMDFKGTREKLSEQIEQAELKLVDARDLVGELALDVQLGNAPQAELDKAVNEQATLTARIDGLKAALAKVDEREADHVADVAEKQRQADEKRLAELQRTCNAAGNRVVDLAAKLADVIAEGSEASREAEELGRKLGVSTAVIAGWMMAAHGVVNGRGLLRGHCAQPADLAEAEQAISGRQ